jgi:hypothetical protein
VVTRKEKVMAKRICNRCGRTTDLIGGHLTADECIAGLCGETAAWAVAVLPVARAIKDKVGLLKEDNWNPESHVEITLTVAECRRLFALLGKSGEKLL